VYKKKNLECYFHGIKLLTCFVTVTKWIFRNNKNLQECSSYVQQLESNQLAGIKVGQLQNQEEL
jgi:hypothetical protein